MSEPPPKAPSAAASRIAAVVRVAPIHDLPRKERARLGVAVRRAQGRPRRIELAPIADADDYQNAVDELRTAWVKDDPTVRAIQDVNATPENTVLAASAGIGEECAALLFDQRRVERAGQAPCALIRRRLDGLGKLADLQLTRARLGLNNDLDPKSPRMQRVRDMFTEAVADVAIATLPPELATDVMGRLRGALEAQSIEVAP